MPTYELICPNCKTEYEIVRTVKQFEELYGKTDCDDCEGSFLVRHYRTPPNFTIPAHSAYNGVTKVSGGSGKKEEASVPINIIDKNPDGSCKVTRIGRKKDIEND